MAGPGPGRGGGSGGTAAPPAPADRTQRPLRMRRCGRRACARRGHQRLRVRGAVSPRAAMATGRARGPARELAPLPAPAAAGTGRVRTGRFLIPSVPGPPRGAGVTVSPQTGGSRRCRRDRAAGAAPGRPQEPSAALAPLEGDGRSRLPQRPGICH